MFGEILEALEIGAEIGVKIAEVIGDVVDVFFD